MRTQAKTLVVAFVVGCGYHGLAEEPAPLVRVQFGELPIILSAPHGGRRDIPGVPERTGDNYPASAGKFVVLRDSGTHELALELARVIEHRFGRKPYFVIAESHRRFLDPNRPPEAAYEHPAAAAVYREYHDALARCCDEVRDRFPAGLLLDLHGQSAAAGTVYRGTQNGRTVQLLTRRFGPAAHTGPHSLCGRLQSRGWTIHPDPLTAPEAAAYDGGHIVQTYGLPERGIDAIQLEFGSDYRRNSQRPRVAGELTSGIAEYAGDYLDLSLAGAEIRPPSPRPPVKSP